MKTDLLWWQKAWVSALSEGECSSWRHSPKSNASETRTTLISPSAKRCNFSFNKNHQSTGSGRRLPHGLAIGCWASIAIAMKKLRICEWAAGASWHCAPCTQPSSILTMPLMKSAWAWLAGLGSWVITPELLLVPHWNTAERQQEKYIFEPLKEDESLTPRSTFSIHHCIPSDIVGIYFAWTKWAK